MFSPSPHDSLTWSSWPDRPFKGGMYMHPVAAPADPRLRSGIAKRMSQVFITIAFQAAVLFLAAGRLAWLWAVVFLGLNLLGVCINAFFLLRHHPETVAERAEAKGMKDWDKIIGTLWSLMQFLFLLLVAGLDVRYGWTAPPPPLWVHLAGSVVFALGFALFSWAMITNAYFTAAVRIQTERRQTVCHTGPYRCVRHPGYVGAILQSLAVPFLLGSPWALLPGGMAALLMVIRTSFEDRTLHAELQGYADYARRVRYRLLPGIW